MRKRRLLREKYAVLTISIAALSILLMTAGSLDPVVTFADPGLEEAVREKLQRPLFKSNLITITELDASSRNIQSLEGIENLRKLVALNLEDNFIGDLSPLKELTMLTDLRLGNNGLTDLKAANLAALAGLPLRRLSLRHDAGLAGKEDRHPLSDISLLGHFSRLERLDLRGNRIADITPLKGLGNLQTLDLRENHLTSIEPIAHLTALQKLNLRGNDIADIEPLRNLTGLAYLNIHSNENLQSLEALTGLVNLQTLILRNVPVGDQVIYLNNLDRLMHLNIRNCGLKDLETIGGLIRRGALQDDREAGIEATLDLRDNDLFIRASDPYEPVRTGWENITHRFPLDFDPLLSPPQFSHASGFYERGFQLELFTDVPGAVIYYTLDGSEPDPGNTEGRVYYYKNEYPREVGDPLGELLTRTFLTLAYAGPIPVLGGVEGPDSITRINTTADARFTGPPGAVFRGTVVRAVTYRDGYPLSPLVTRSFFVGDGLEKRYPMPLLSVVTAEPNLFDYETGIHVAGKAFDDIMLDDPPENLELGNYFKRGAEWEREANIEFFAPGGELLLNQAAGVRVHGGVGRARANKTLRFYARSEYGVSRFNVQLFEGRETNQFKRFIVRNSGNDWRSTLFRDALMQSLVEDLGMDQQAYQPAALFINGVYWGVYNIRDRIDRFYLASEHGVDPGEVDLLSGNTVLIEGSNRHYVEMLEYIEFHDIRLNSVYEHVNTMIDVKNYINYCTSQIYFDNTDWPGSNIKYWRKQTGQYDPEAPYGHDGRWRWILYDTDFGFGLYGGADAYMHNTLAFATEAGGESWPNPDWSTFLLRTLLENPLFQVDFINRLADHLNTLFLPEVVIEKINDMQKGLAPLMQEHIDRWGAPYSLQRWEENVEVMRIFARKRPEALRGHISDYFGLNGTAKVTFDTDFSKGTIIVNTIDTGNIPSNKDEEQAGWTGIYFKGVPIRITAVSKPGYVFSGWEELGTDAEVLSLELLEDLTLTAVFTEK